VVKARRGRILLLALALTGAGVLAGVHFLVHYTAPIAAGIYLLAMLCFQRLSEQTPGGFPVGRVACSWRLAIFAVSFIPHLLGVPTAFPQPAAGQQWSIERERIQKQFSQLAGTSIMLVRYGPAHGAGREWVYNSADIDHTRAVWVHDLGGQQNEDLCHQCPDRRI